MNYAKLNEGSEVSNTEAEIALLRKVLGKLSPELKKQIAKSLELERAHFARSSAPGHLIWYPHKLAVCAAFERLTK